MVARTCGDDDNDNDDGDDDCDDDGDGEGDDDDSDDDDVIDPKPKLRHAARHLMTLVMLDINPERGRAAHSMQPAITFCAACVLK